MTSRAEQKKRAVEAREGFVRASARLAGGNLFGLDPVKASVAALGAGLLLGYFPGLRRFLANIAVRSVGR